jgi:Flp pilus assembly protein TadD
MIANGLDRGHVDSPIRDSLGLITVGREEHEALVAEVTRLRAERGDELFAAAMATSGADRIDLLRRTIAVNPVRADAHGELGRACSAAGNHGDAVTHLATAVLRDPDSSRWRRELGLAQASAGDLDAATASLRAAVAHDPADADSHGALGDVCRQKARAHHDHTCLAEARDAYRAANQITSDNTTWLVHEAHLDVLLSGNKTERAAAVAGFHDLSRYVKYLISRKPDPSNQVELLRFMLTIEWLPGDVADALRALVAKHDPDAT